MPTLNSSSFISFLALLISSYCAKASNHVHSPIKGAGQCNEPQEIGEPLICVVIRTYRGHGEGHFPYLEELLHSLKSQTFSRWASSSSAFISI